MQNNDINLGNFENSNELQTNTEQEVRTSNMTEYDENVRCYKENDNETEKETQYWC